MGKKNIYVTQPTLPKLEDYISSMEKIWNSKVLTNNGPFHQKLEEELTEYLQVQKLSLFNNGTSALLCAIQSLKLQGEVITTPYTFVATTHALAWNNLTPVFADISRDTFNLDPVKVEQAITENTCAILAVHCYGVPCDVEGLAKLAKKYNLKLIYDAAHAFNVYLNDQNLLNYGDISVLSFHATKVFNTFEGGAVISHNEEQKKLIDKLKNFGIVDEVTIEEVGSNGKMNEVSAAMGLLQLKRVNQENRLRKEVHAFYTSELSSISGLSFFEPSEEVKWNYSYFPMLVEEEFPISRDELYEKLKEENIFTRRYFHPIISSLPMYKDLPSASHVNLPVANEIGDKILCLPMYAGLTNEDRERVICAIKKIAGTNL